MEKTIKAIGWDNANDSIPMVLIGARDRATLNKSVGSYVKVARKHGRQTAESIAIIHPIFREHIGNAMLNTKLAEALIIGRNGTAVGNKITLDPRVTETEVTAFMEQVRGARAGQYSIADVLGAALMQSARARAQPQDAEQEG